MNTSSNPEIAVLQNQVAEVLLRIADLSHKMDSMGQSFVGRTEYELRHHELDVKVAALVRYRWLGTIVTIALTALITGLVAFFLSHLPVAAMTQNNTPSSTVSGKSGSSNGSTATAHSDATSTPANPSASQTSNGGATVTVPLVPPLP